jgi:pentapeptide repeat protein
MMEEPQPNDFRRTLSHGIQSISSGLGALTTRASRWWQTLAPQRQKLLLGLGGAMVLILVVFMVVEIPHRQAAPLKAKIQRERTSLPPHERLKLEHDARKLENDARTTLIQAIGGTVLLIGLFFTWRSIRVTERNLQLTQNTALRNLQLTQDRQTTEHYTRAIEQLGSDKLEVQLGAIYALERIARDSEQDHWPIMEILTAYVRERAPRKDEGYNNQLPWGIRPKLAADIQAILTVIGRRTRTYGKGEDLLLNLTSTDLCGALLWKAHLEGALLSNSCLDRATLAEAHLQGARLRDAHLEGVVLDHADLTDANLDGAYLTGASIYNTCLAGASLREITAEGFLQITPEQLSTLPRGCLYKATLHPGFQELYPHLFEF